MRVYLLCAFAVALICAHGEEKEGKAIYEWRVLESFALPGVSLINPMCSSVEWCSQSNSSGAVETEKRDRSADETRRKLDEIRRSRVRRSFSTMFKRTKQILSVLLIGIALALEKHGKVGKCFAAIMVVLVFYLVYSQMNNSFETQSTDAREKVMMRDEIMKKLR